MSEQHAIKLLFVINPSAGNNSTPWKEIIHNYFTKKDYVVDYFSLTENVNEKDIKEYIEQTQPGKVIAVGGDGTVAMLVNILGGTNTPLGILPAGSANGMAAELGISDIPEEAIRVIETGIIKCSDVIKINNKRICLHLSDIGLNAQLIKYFDEGKLRGKMGYARGILKTLWYKEKMQVIIQTRNLEVKRHAFMVVLANASKYGTGAVINPQGQLDDGNFEVVIVRKLSLWSLFKMLIKPGSFNPKKIETFHSTAVDIKTIKSVHFQIDGEYMGKVRELTARIIPHYINLILPANNKQ